MTEQRWIVFGKYLINQQRVQLQWLHKKLNQKKWKKK